MPYRFMSWVFTLSALWFSAHGYFIKTTCCIGMVILNNQLAYEQREKQVLKRLMAQLHRLSADKTEGD